MGLFFSCKDIKNKGRGLTFDDVLIVPQFSEVLSRKNTYLTTRLTKNYSIDLPIVTSNMDTITEAPMAMAMGELGGCGIVHRFMSVERQVAEIKKIKHFFDQRQIKLPIAASVGVRSDEEERILALVEAGANILTIDIAHGDSVMMVNTLKLVKKLAPKVDVIAGNVATYDATMRLIDQGADAIKVGIGPGSMCTTRIITGCGLPQLTAICLCFEAAEKHNIPIIADGGIKTSGDLVKAFACGAESAMLGSMVAGCLETPGRIRNGKKRYRGMASKDAQISWRGELPLGMAPEGESTTVACKGHVSDVVLEISGGIRSGMSYLNAQSILQIKEQASFIEISTMGLKESRPHGLEA